MNNIKITLHNNKKYDAVNLDNIDILEDENNATTIDIEFPKEYENYSKRIDFMNLRREKWTTSLYAPEDNRNQYADNFDKLNFTFTIPNSMAKRGELQIQPIAYLADGTNTIVPFRVLIVTINNSILYAKVQGQNNPDIIVKAYEYANIALETANEANTRSKHAEELAIESAESAKQSEISAKNAENSAKNAQTSAKNSETSAKNSEASAKTAQTSAKEAQTSADNADKRATSAETVSNEANTKSTNAVNTANEANAKATKTLEIVDELSVSSEEIDCEEQANVVIETDSTTKHKNIKFSIPSPKKGTSYRNKGIWDSSVSYVNDQYYIDTVTLYGCTYWCKISNTNQMPVNSTESEYWGILALKGSDAGITIVDNLLSTNADYVLSANQGNVIKNLITDQDAQISSIKLKDTNQDNEISNIKNNYSCIKNNDGGFSCGDSSENNSGLIFRNFMVCDQDGKIPALRLIDSIYPIGSIYLSVNSTNPSTLFGGTWEAIQDKFLLSAGTIYSAGTTGGEATHTLTTEEMPIHKHDNYISVTGSQTSHNHSLLSGSGKTTNAAGLGYSYCYAVGGPDNDSSSRWYQNSTPKEGTAIVSSSTPAVNITSSISNENAGSGQAHNNMPPYLTVYMWKRIS